MPQETIIQILIQGGAVGIAFYALYIIKKQANGANTRMQAAIDRNTDAWAQNKEVMGKFSEKLDELIRRPA